MAKKAKKKTTKKKSSKAKSGSKSGSATTTTSEAFWAETEEKLKRSGGFDHFWKPAKDMNPTDIRPVVFSPKTDIVKTFTHWINRKPYGCSGKNCIFCDAARKHESANKGQKPREACQVRVLMTGIVRDRDGDKLCILDLPPGLAKDLMDVAKDVGNSVFDKKKGHDFRIKPKSSGFGYTVSAVTQASSWGMDVELFDLEKCHKAVPEEVDAEKMVKEYMGR